jgi:hypothetical protein
MKSSTVKIVLGLVLIIGVVAWVAMRHEKNPLIAQINEVYPFWTKQDSFSESMPTYTVCYEKSSAYQAAVNAVGIKKITEQCLAEATFLYKTSQAQGLFKTATLEDWQDEAFLEALSKKAQEADDDFDK